MTNQVISSKREKENQQQNHSIFVIIFHYLSFIIFFITVIDFINLCEWMNEWMNELSSLENNLINSKRPKTIIYLFIFPFKKKNSQKFNEIETKLTNMVMNDSGCIVDFVGAFPVFFNMFHKNRELHWIVWLC